MAMMEKRALGFKASEEANGMECLLIVGKKGD